MANWFYEDSLNHKGWDALGGKKKTGKAKNLRPFQNAYGKSKTRSLINPDPTQTKTGNTIQTGQRPDTNNQESSRSFNSNKAKDRFENAKEAARNRDPFYRNINQANSSRQRALEMEKQNRVKRSVHMK